jgi:hypothetical protein
MYVCTAAYEKRGKRRAQARPHCLTLYCKGVAFGKVSTLKRHIETQST